MPSSSHQPQQEKATKSYYDSVVALSTTDISEPLYKHDKKTPLQWLGIVLKIGIVLYLGIRPDYMLLEGYLSHHKVYYFTWISVILAAEIILNNLVDWTQVLGNVSGTVFFVATWAFYYVGLLLWFVVVKEPLRKRMGKAKFIMISEFVFSCMWMGIGCGLRSFCQSVHTGAFGGKFPLSETASTTIGACIVLVGYFFKAWACALTGFNSYFWRDMLTDIPNDRFVTSSLYKMTSHPTYTLGYLQGLGAAIFYRSVEGMLAWLVMQISILLFAHTIEKSFIERTYLNVAANINDDDNKNSGHSSNEREDEEAPRHMEASRESGSQHAATTLQASPQGDYEA